MGALQKSKYEPLWTDAGAVFYDSEILREKFTFSDKYSDEVFCNYKIVKKQGSKPLIMLPRTLFPLGDDRRCQGIDINVDLVAEPKNPAQWEAAESVINEWNEGNTEYIIEASTGFGKTYLGCVSIWYHQVSTLVLITKSDLEEQWRSSFKKFMGLNDDDIGLIKGDIMDVAGKKVVIGYVQSLMKDGRYPGWVYKHFGFVISDEVHLMGADKFSNCMWQLPAMFRLGLSATLDRSDDREHVFHSHCGGIRVKAHLLPMPYNVVAVFTGVMVPTNLWFRPGRMMKLNKWLAKHKKRQALISKAIMKAVAKGRNIVAFCDTLDHIEFAYNSLVDAGMKISQIGKYVGGANSEKAKAGMREEAHKQVVFATYKMTSYGTDFPHWDTAVLMTPRADIRQIIGRVLREDEDKAIPLVFDFVDNHSILINLFKSRRKYYDLTADQVIER